MNQHLCSDECTQAQKALNLQTFSQRSKENTYEQADKNVRNRFTRELKKAAENSPTMHDLLKAAFEEYKAEVKQKKRQAKALSLSEKELNAWISQQYQRIDEIISD
ncbi:hypothetical protein LJC07_02775 [Christensenellaceae bacterium OttesenSCG-928-L17]|nr:hypothetical protein [Christensenellaceae bacterium OttesenSCG-928-L17]